MFTGISKRLAIVLLYLTTATAGATGSTRQPDSLLWGSLRPGPFAVGYRSSFEFDYTRQYDSNYAVDSSSSLTNKPRPILIDIWYPAKKTAAQPMKYREYLNVASADLQLSSFTQRLAYNMRKVICEETVGKVPSKASPAEMAAFNRLLRTNTFACKNVPVAAGRFPVVIYHPGVNGTPEDSSVLFEYLASNGFVVISSAYQAPDAYNVSCGGGDISCDFRDMEFLSRYARGLKFVDADKLGAMGHSLGAWMTFAWIAEPDSSVRAWVSLDSGLEYDTVETSGVESLQFQMKRNKNTIRASSLRFASKEREANFDDIGSYLKFGDQYQATVSHCTHNDFLTHGAIRPALLPAKWPDKSRRASYDLICRHVLTYFDAILNRKPEARKILENRTRADDVKTGFTLRYKPAIPANPTPRQLSLYVRQQGIEKAVGLVLSLGKDVEALVPAAHVLVQDGDVKTVHIILNRIDKDRPNLASVHALRGQALLLSGDRKGALSAYQRGKEILDSEKDPSPVWKYYIEEGLKELGQSNPPKKSP